MPCSLTLLAEGADVTKEGGEHTPGDGEDTPEGGENTPGDGDVTPEGEGSTPGGGDATVQQQLRSAEQRGLLKCPSSCCSCSSSPRGAPSPVVLHLPSLPLHVVVPGDAPGGGEEEETSAGGCPASQGISRTRTLSPPSLTTSRKAPVCRRPPRPAGVPAPPKPPMPQGGQREAAWLRRASLGSRLAVGV